MEKLYFDESYFNEATESWTQGSFQLSKFDVKLRNGWDKAMDEGHFRYKLDIEETRIIGDKNYVAQLNVLRATERRKPDEINTLNQPFNPASFNFTKIKQDEILFEMIKGEKSSGDCNNHDVVENASGDCNNHDVVENASGDCNNHDVVENASGDCNNHDVVENASGDCNNHDVVENGNSAAVKRVRNLVIINVSPLEYGHILLVPDIDACRPQILTQYSIQLSIESMLLSKHRGFRVGFNSLCAFASVNHQHLHAYYLDRELFVESSPVEHVCDNLYELLTMPTKGFAFQLHGSSVESLSRTLFNIADHFQRNEIAHNLFMTRGLVFNEDPLSQNRTIRVYMWPRQKFIGLKDEAAFNVALVELAGHIPVKIKELFYELDEKKIEDTMQEAALDELEYNKIKQDVIKICQQPSSI